jgi:hypothetical protein
MSFKLCLVVVAECFNVFVSRIVTTEGHAVAQLVKALRYKPKVRGLNSRWCHCNFSLTYSFLPHYGHGVDSDFKRNEYQEYFRGGVKAASAWV